MAEQLPPGPYKNIDLGDGQSVPWYIIPFDKHGDCTAPLTRAHLVAAIRDNGYTDVFLFSHGWNNDWKSSSERYDDFIDNYIKMRRQYNLPYAAPHKPLLIGIFWPSTALVMPWEQGPKFAGGGAGVRRDSEMDQLMRELADLAPLLDAGKRERFYALAQQAGPLSAAEGRELAELSLPIYNAAPNADDDAGGVRDTASTVDDILAVWRLAAKDRARVNSVALDENGFPIAAPASPAAGAAPAGVAGFLGLPDPRDIVRVMTVYQMKDRAAVVGGNGVSRLLSDMLAASSTARVHLVGHSYGAKVVLSATCARPLPRKVNSALLLEPAVNGWCFAASVTKRADGAPGGYRAAFDRIEQPILTTYSSHDFPLTKVFHLAVRRSDDLGEVKIAGGGRPKPPNDFAALGGFGPIGLSDTECQFFDLKPIGAKYDLNSGARVIALNGDDAITSHGDISVPGTWWALYNQVSDETAAPV